MSKYSNLPVSGKRLNTLLHILKSFSLPLLLFGLIISESVVKPFVTFKSIARLNPANILIQMLLAWVTNSCINDENLGARSFGHSSGHRSNVPALMLNASLKSPPDARSALVK